MQPLTKLDLFDIVAGECYSYGFPKERVDAVQIENGVDTLVLPKGAIVVGIKFFCYMLFTCE